MTTEDATVYLPTVHFTREGFPMSKRRGREREKKGGPPKIITLSRREFWISIDTDDGDIISHNHEAVPSPHERDEITAWAIGTLTKYGLFPDTPLSVRDAIWG